MSWKTIIGFILVLLINGAALLYMNKKNQKSAFVLTKTVFDEFQGTKDIQKKMTLAEEMQTQQLDSIKLELTRLHSAKDQSSKTRYNALLQQYQNQYKTYYAANEKLTTSYNEEIWKQLNQYIQEYGKENGYTYVFGANGNGTLMYASEGEDITKEIVSFVNKKYSGK